METTGPEVVPVPSEENPARHSRVPTTEEVRSLCTVMSVEGTWNKSHISSTKK